MDAETARSDSFGQMVLLGVDTARLGEYYFCDATRPLGPRGDSSILGSTCAKSEGGGGFREIGGTCWKGIALHAAERRMVLVLD